MFCSVLLCYFVVRAFEGHGHSEATQVCVRHAGHPSFHPRREGVAVAAAVVAANGGAPRLVKWGGAGGRSSRLAKQREELTQVPSQSTPLIKLVSLRGMYRLIYIS
jgi:hypothetical protein